MAYIGNGPGTIRQGRRAVYEFTSTANQTAFSGTDENGLTLDLLQANDNDVYLNGVRLIITDDYTISGDVLTLTSGAASGDKLIIMTQDEIANDASYSKAASDSRYINYDGDIVNGTIQIGGSGNNITFADNNKAIFGDDSDLKIWPKVKQEKWLYDIFDNKKSVDFWTKAFDRRYKLLDDDWDRPWTFSNLINNRLNVFPNKNLISNIGEDDVALHSNPKKWNNLKLENMKFPLNHPKIICCDRIVDKFLTNEGFSIPKLSYRIKNKLRKLFF